MITVVRTVEGKKEKKQIEWRDFDPATDVPCGKPARIIFRLEMIQKMRLSDSLWFHNQAQKEKARPFGLDMGFLALHARQSAAAIDLEGNDGKDDAHKMCYVAAERRPGMTDHYLVPMKYCQVVSISSKIKKVAAKATAALGLGENDEERAVA